jgi:hypothetical protein
VSGPRERLPELIEASDMEGVVQLLAPLAEVERAALAPGARMELVRLVELEHQPGVVSYGREAARLRRQAQVAALAWLGTGDIADFPSARRMRRGDSVIEDELFSRVHQTLPADAAYGVLRDRRPPWLRDFADSYAPEYGLAWELVWRLAADGLVPRPESPQYLRRLVQDGWHLTERVRHDPRLLDVDLPRLLALPEGPLWLAEHDRPTPPFGVERRRGDDKTVWSPLLVSAFPPGHPLRNSLLDRTMDELERDLEPQKAARYHRFLEGLKPTVDELTARRERYLGLVDHRVPAVVGFAVRGLARLDREDRLPAMQALARLPPALHARSAETARTAARLIAAVAEREPGLAGQVALALVPALTHPAPDVQRAAVSGLLPGLAVDAGAARAAAEALPSMSAAVAVSLREVLGEAGGPACVPPSRSGRDLSELEVAATRLPAELARMAGADGALAAARARAEPPAVRLQPWRAMSPTPPGEVVRPVRDTDELIALLLRLVDGEGSVIDAERALDGLSALGSRRPADLARRVGPLLKRVRHWWDEVHKDMDRRRQRDFCLLVATWLEPERGAQPEAPLDSAPAWLAGRIREVALDLAERRARRLLALPTDVRGWIDPAVLVTRAVEAGQEIRPMDAATALMRLAPWGRASAVAGASRLDGPLGGAMRAACAGEESAGAGPLVEGALRWLRAQPHAGPPWLFGGSDTTARPRASADDLHAEMQQSWSVAAVSREEELARLDQWTEWERAVEYERPRRYWPGWELRQWPGDHDWIWREHPAPSFVLPVLLDPEEPLPAPALQVLFAELADPAPEGRVLVGDVIAQAIGDGRAGSAELAAALESFSSRGGQAGRAVAALRSGAARSALHRAVVRRALVRSLPSWIGQPARALCELLELLDELCAADRAGVPGSEARGALERRTRGRSRSATLARAVLARPADGDDWPAEAAALALAARVERARRLAGPAELAGEDENEPFAKRSTSR